MREDQSRGTILCYMRMTRRRAMFCKQACAVFLLRRVVAHRCRAAYVTSVFLYDCGRSIAQARTQWCMRRAVLSMRKCAASAHLSSACAAALARRSPARLVAAVHIDLVCKCLPRVSANRRMFHCRIRPPPAVDAVACTCCRSISRARPCPPRPLGQSVDEQSSARCSALVEVHALAQSPYVACTPVAVFLPALESHHLQTLRDVAAPVARRQLSAAFFGRNIAAQYRSRSFRCQRVAAPHSFCHLLVPHRENCLCRARKCQYREFLQAANICR